jgi:Flp pilus assembly pilin Flp
MKDEKILEYALLATLVAVAAAANIQTARRHFQNPAPAVTVAQPAPQSMLGG